MRQFPFLHVKSLLLSTSNREKSQETRKYIGISKCFAIFLWFHFTSQNMNSKSLSIFPSHSKKIHKRNSKYDIISVETSCCWIMTSLLPNSVVSLLRWFNEVKPWNVLFRAKNTQKLLWFMMKWTSWRTRFKSFILLYFVYIIRVLFALEAKAMIRTKRIIKGCDSFYLVYIRTAIFSSSFFPFIFSYNFVVQKGYFHIAGTWLEIGKRNMSKCDKIWITAIEGLVTKNTFSILNTKSVVVIAKRVKWSEPELELHEIFLLSNFGAS